jgi:hypothetical protein|tara:strand:- start:1068 stop:1184 length:117 start_codon:yes stop_codon:yes gene_type:complete
MDKRVGKATSRVVLVIFVAEVALAIAETLDADRGDARG